MIYYAIIIVMTLMGAIGSLFFKRASGSGGIVALLMNYNLYVGGFIYVTSAFLNIFILRVLDYSVVLPLTAITYIWTMIISYLILKEKISSKKIAGVILIVIGAVCVTL